MKEGIHPKNHKVIFQDVNSGYRFLSTSTKTSNETAEWEDGNTYPVIKVEVSSDTHRFIQAARNSMKKADELSSSKNAITWGNKAGLRVCLFLL